MKTLANRIPPLYRRSLDDAYALMDAGIEPTSALKQAANDNGIPYGDAMGAFVAWAHDYMRT